MKILSSSDIIKMEKDYIAKSDSHSAESIMLLAGNVVANWIDKKLLKDHMKILILCGPGNNGGDGYATAQVLLERGESPDVYPFISPKSSLARKMSKEYSGNLLEEFDFDKISEYDLVIDAIFGIGKLRPFNDDQLNAIRLINNYSKCILSIDIPSGMNPNGVSTMEGIHAHETLTFHCPKPGFLIMKNYIRTGDWIIRNLGLDPDPNSRQNIPTYITEKTVSNFFPKRQPFSHKGHYGHVLVIGGRKGMAGACYLSGSAAYRMGAGLVTIASCEANRGIIQGLLPESLFLVSGSNEISEIHYQEDTYSSILIGPGMGQDHFAINALNKFLTESEEAIVLDADALNIISRQQWQDRLFPGSILTPHPKEFDRLFGEHSEDYERRETQVSKSKELGIFIILKGKYTSVTTPEGKLFINSSGNPGMSTGGTGDVLAGMIASLVGQGYSPERSCIYSVYLHGLAGDLAAKKMGMPFMLARDLIEQFPLALNKVK